MMHEPTEHSRGELLLVDPAVTDCGAIPPKFTRTKRWRKFKRRALTLRYIGFSTLTGTMSTGFSWNAQSALTGVNYSPTQNASTINKRQSFGTAVGTNVQPGGCDECFSFQQGIVAGGSATLNLNGMTDLLQRAAVPIVRAKGHQFRVLSAVDDPTISPAPTATSVGLVTNNGVATPSALDFSAGGSGLTLVLTADAGVITEVTIGAAGTGYIPNATFIVTPVQSGGSGGVISVTTNSSGVPTAVAIDAGGTGYTSATVPSVALGQYCVYTGGAHMYFDTNGAGFCTVSATQKNVLLINLDGANAITFEIDVYGATT